MRIVGFVEGATLAKGGLGIVGVPTILGSTAAKGHQIALLVGGPPIAGREQFVVPDLEHALRRKEGAGTFGLVAFKAWEKWAFAPLMVWRANRLVRTADFVSLHSLYSFPVFAGFLLARIHRKPYGLWPHGVLAEVQRRLSVRKKRLYDTLIARRIIANASVLFYSGDRERQDAKGSYVLQSGGEKSNKSVPSVVIADCFDTSEFASLPEPGSFRRRYLNGHTGPLILFLARLNAKKGLHLLAQSMAIVAAKLPEARLAIVGPPDPAGFEGQVRRWIRESGIEGVTFVTGKVDFETKLQAFADADIYVLPSEAENFGISIFEAMASRVPVVVSDTLEFSEHIANAQAGLVVQREPNKMAAAMIRLLESPDLRQQMGQNGARLAQSFTLEETGTKVVRTIECILHQQQLPVDLTL